MGTIGAGSGRCGTATVAGAVVTVFGFWMVPFGSAPPIFGWWCEYHSFSAQLTTEAPPCSRAHSARRALIELPSAGLVSAPPRDTASQMRHAASTTATPAKMRRRRRWTGERDQRALRGGGGGGVSRSSSSLFSRVGLSTDTPGVAARGTGGTTLPL